MEFLQRISGLLLILFLSGCGYHLSNSSVGVTDYGHTVWVDFIGNTSSSSTAQTVLRRELFDQLQARRALIPAQNPTDSDIVISGTLNSYSIQPLSYSALDKVREYRLKIEVLLEVRKHNSAKALWKGVLQANQDFPVNAILELQKNAEEAALVSASHKIAMELIASMEDSY